jgi:hypothetical protein
MSATGEIQQISNSATSRLEGALQGTGIGLAAIALWLAPPTIAGLLCVLVGDAEGGFWGAVTGISLAWGFAGLVVVPTAACLFAARRLDRGMPALMALLTGFVLYIPGAYVALALIILAGDSSGLFSGPGMD